MKIAMAVIKVPTNFNIDLEFEIPEFYRRFFALLIDMVMEYFYLRIASEILISIQRNAGSGDDAQHNLWAIGLLLFVPVTVFLSCRQPISGIGNLKHLFLMRLRSGR